MEENKKDGSANGGQEKGKRFNKKYLLICLVVILAAAAYGWYSYNLPEKRLERALQNADALMEQQDYEAAAAAYEQAETINGVSPAALEGRILAGLRMADKEADSAKDIPSRAQVCRQYEEIINLCDNAAKTAGDTAGADFTQYRTEAEEKKSAIEKGIAADYEKADYVTKTEDRSGTVSLADGTQVPYTQYYDLVQIGDEDYPYAETINAALKKQMDEYFADAGNDLTSVIKSAGSAGDDAYRDYVGVDGVYSGQGLFCVRYVHVRVIGGVQSNEYCGVTFRLADAEKVSLGEMTGKTEIGLHRLFRQEVWSWMKQEGYGDIKKSDVEEYVEDIDAEEYKYCLLDDGTLCLVIDQTVPFFANKQEIVKIPFELDEEAID